MTRRIPPITGNDISVAPLRSTAFRGGRLKVEAIQRCADHWAIGDLVGKAGRVRTVPIPDWLKTA